MYGQAAGIYNHASLALSRRNHTGVDLAMDMVSLTYNVCSLIAMLASLEIGPLAVLVCHVVDKRRARHYVVCLINCRIARHSVYDLVKCRVRAHHESICRSTIEHLLICARKKPSQDSIRYSPLLCALIDESKVAALFNLVRRNMVP